MLTRLIQWLTKPEPVETISFSLSEFEKEIESNPALKAEMLRLAERMEKERQQQHVPFDGLPF